MWQVAAVLLSWPVPVVEVRVGDVVWVERADQGGAVMRVYGREGELRAEQRFAANVALDGDRVVVWEQGRFVVVRRMLDGAEKAQAWWDRARYVGPDWMSWREGGRLMVGRVSGRGDAAEVAADAILRMDREGRAVFERGGKVGFAELAAIGTTETRYEKATIDDGGVKDGMAVLKSDGKWGVVDLGGKWVLEPKFAAVGLAGGGEAAGEGRIFAAIEDGKAERAWRMYRSNGEGLGDTEYRDWSTFEGGVARVRMVRGRAVRYMDVYGRFVLGPFVDGWAFEPAGVASGGAAWVRDAVGWRVIDRAGKTKFRAPEGYVPVEMAWPQPMVAVSADKRRVVVYELPGWQ